MHSAWNSETMQDVKEIETFGEFSPEKQKQDRFSIKNNEMIL